MKINAVGTELFNADGQTDIQADTKQLIVAIRNFAGVPKN